MKIETSCCFNAMGAVGMEVMAGNQIQQRGYTTKFKGFDFPDTEFTPKSFECTGCSNSCEVVKGLVADEVKAMRGDNRCKWSSSI